jgi:hypothetical protein
LSSTNFDSLVVGGVPWLPGSLAGLVRQPIPGSRVIYVGASAKSTVPDGVMTAATLFGASGALAQLGGRTNMGDIVYVLPGHSESVSAADMGSDTGAASGFSVIGLGVGRQRPAFNWTAAASTWLLDTDGVEIANCILNLCGNTATGALTVTTPITVSGVSCQIVGCHINWGRDADTGCGSTLGAIAVTAGGFKFLSNRCINLDTAGTLAVSLLSINGSDDLIVQGNKITGGTTSTTVGPIHFVTTASLNVDINGNQIENLHASSTKCLTSAVAGVTGYVGYNQFRVQSGIVAETIATTPFLCSFYQNFTSNTDTRNGALDVALGTSA